MTKLVRFDEEHYGYLVERTRDITMEEVSSLREMFELAYPGKRIIVMQADEFIDLTGQYEIVPIREDVPDFGLQAAYKGQLPITDVWVQAARTHDL